MNRPLGVVWCGVVLAGVGSSDEWGGFWGVAVYMLWFSVVPGCGGGLAGPGQPYAGSALSRSRAVVNASAQG